MFRKKSKLLKTPKRTRSLLSSSTLRTKLTPRLKKYKNFLMKRSLIRQIAQRRDNMKTARKLRSIHLKTILTKKRMKKSNRSNKNSQKSSVK